MKFDCVTANTFSHTFLYACERNPKIVSNCELPHPDCLPIYFLSTDGLSGFAISTLTRELLCAYSLNSNGDSVVITAIMKGAKHLNCFDGYLTEFYKSHGFVEYKRVPNWEKDGPDVVFLRLTD